MRQERRRGIGRRTGDRYPAADLLRASGPRLRLDHMVREPSTFTLAGAVNVALLGALGIEGLLAGRTAQGVPRRAQPEPAQPAAAAGGRSRRGRGRGVADRASLGPACPGWARRRACHTRRPSRPPGEPCTAAARPPDRTHLADLVAATALRVPNHPAVVDVTAATTLTWADLDACRLGRGRAAARTRGRASGTGWPSGCPTGRRTAWRCSARCGPARSPSRAPRVPRPGSWPPCSSDCRPAVLVTADGSDGAPAPDPARAPGSGRAGRAGAGRAGRR